MKTENKRIITPGEVSTKDFHQYLLGIVSPRPIAFVSTVDKEGNENLAPYSFYNAFSSNPPIVVFSSNRRVRDNTTKDTLSNIYETKEVVINAVSHAIVQQMAISSVEFDSGTSEFTKSGLTPVASDLIRPPRVLESPASMECKVNEIIKLGDHGGAGHLIIAEVLRIHIEESVIDNNRPNPHKMDLMGRMGRAFYVRASGAAVQTIVQPVVPITIGFDQLPNSAQNSIILTGNDLGKLASVVYYPESSEWEFLAFTDPHIQQLISENKDLKDWHLYTREILKTGNTDLALKVILLADQKVR